MKNGNAMKRFWKENSLRATLQNRKMADIGFVMFGLLMTQFKIIEL